VDDIFLLTASQKLRTEFWAGLQARFKVGQAEEINYILGIKIDRTKTSMRWTQKAYAEEILKRFNVTNAKPRTTPIAKGTKLLPKSDDDKRPVTFPYRECIGALLYLAICTRPDLIMPLSLLGKYQSNPSVDHVFVLKGVLRYLAGTTEYGLTYWLSRTEPVYAITDSNHNLSHSRKLYEQDPRACHPRGGYLLMRGGAAFSWSSTNVKGTSTSTAEAEYRTASACSKTLIWAQELLKEVGWDTPTPTLMQIDNQSAIRMAQNIASQNKTSHIRVHEMQLNEAFTNGDVNPEYVPTDDNPADLLTKPLAYKEFNRHRATMLGTIEKCNQHELSKKLS
jgi:hypothetical protein